MKLLYININEYTEEDIAATFEELHIQYEKLKFASKDIFYAGEEVTESIDSRVSHGNYDAVFSVDYLEVLSLIADKYSIPYIAWSYDCPIVYENIKSLKLPSTFLFSFDRKECERIKKTDTDARIRHLPLAVNTKRYEKLFNTLPDHGNNIPDMEISFVGQLYKKNDYLQELLSDIGEYGRGFIEAVRDSNSFDYTFDTTQALSERVMKLISTPGLIKKAGSIYEVTGDMKAVPKELIREQIMIDTTAHERISILKKLSQCHDVYLYSGDDDDSLYKVKKCGTIDYDNVMPWVFKRSRINLNITYRMIRSAIPQRCLDIMAAGGFLLSNRQAELVEHFKEGIEAEF